MTFPQPDLWSTNFKTGRPTLKWVKGHNIGSYTIYTYCCKAGRLHPEILQPLVEAGGYVLHPSHCPAQLPNAHFCKAASYDHNLHVVVVFTCDIELQETLPGRHRAWPAGRQFFLLPPSFQPSQERT